MSHWEQCRARVLAHADVLWSRVAARKLNASAVDGLLWSYLNQPAYYAEWQIELHHQAMERGNEVVNSLKHLRTK
jgi:hypothetical protein